jgi:hypothetical protein
MIDCSSAVVPDYSDAAALAAVAANRVADVAVEGSVIDQPTFFTGRHTHARHETFDIVTEHGLRLRVVDNVSLAPAIPVQIGDSVVVQGQLVPKPGESLIHDTHHCPGPGWHRGGWIEWRGHRYA